MTSEKESEIPFKTRAKMLGLGMKETILNPLTNSTISYDPETKNVMVERNENDEPQELHPGIPVSLRIKAAGAGIKETILHPFTDSTVSIDAENNEINVTRK